MNDDPSLAAIGSQPDDMDQASSEIDLRGRAVIESLGLGEITSMTIVTASGRNSLLVHLASSTAGAALVTSVLKNWLFRRQPLVVVPDGRRVFLHGGSAKICVDVLAVL